MRPANPEPQSITTAAWPWRNRQPEQTPLGFGAAGPAPRIVSVRAAITGCLILAQEATGAISGLVPLHKWRARAVGSRRGRVPLPHLRRLAGGRPRSQRAPRQEPVGVDEAL